jgi:hypothetical protein
MDLIDTLIWAEILVKTTFLGTPNLDSPRRLNLIRNDQLLIYWTFKA